VVHALKGAGYCATGCNLSIIDVKGTLAALDRQERDYSLELAGKVITEVKLELVCPDDRVDTAVRIIRDNARTGQPHAGWVYVSDIKGGLPHRRECLR
jgi:nitrogen regulatory protein P-II 1